ncbi:alpha/beta fold hydrolase [Thermodesulfobacteriota bacterium]
MSFAKADNIDIAYETFGKKSNRPLVLIMGLGGQLVSWPEAFCKKLAASGHYVVRYDNRDAGLSSKMPDAGIPDIAAAMAAKRRGERLNSPYSLSDMAADTAGLMDALNLEKAHVCGISMGGMIAQILAIAHPRRVLSLISMESTTGRPELPSPNPEAMQALLSPTPQEREAYICHRIKVMRVFAGGSDKFDEDAERAVSALTFDRGLCPEGFMRQYAALLAAESRQEVLGSLSMPTLVIHGSHDPLVTLAHGRDTAESIPGAELLVVEGLGHGLAYPRLWDSMVAAVSGHTAGASEE